MIDLKIKYNAFLQRFYKGSVFMDDPERTAQQKERFMAGFKAIIQELNNILEEIKQKGYIPTDDEVLGGFNI